MVRLRFLSLGLPQPFGEGEEEMFLGGMTPSSQRRSSGFILGSYRLVQVLRSAGFLSCSC